jgi:DNA-binding transcriptional MerR regulator
VSEMSIGEFARRSRLSPKALRLYDKLGLLQPARVDADSGYRFYEVAQLERARLVAALRQLQVPLAEIKAIFGLKSEVAAARIGEYWAAVEIEHTARCELARYLVDLFSGRRSVMYEVSTRDIPSRSLLCLKRNVDGQEGAWAFGKEFVAMIRQHPLPHLEGRAGAVFCIYWGEVSEDSDGPIEWCRPVPDDLAVALVGEILELHLRTSRRTARRSSISAPEDRPLRRSGRWSRSRCTYGPSSTLPVQVTWE